MDNDISESDFWNMTLAELERAIQSRQRVKKAKAQEQATFDYKLADLIGRSISRIYHSGNRMPDIAEAYPTLFDTEMIAEKKRAAKAELSAQRFKQFADSYNKRFNEGGRK